MPTLRRRPKILRCFYCNTSQNRRFEPGTPLQFICANCDATNWLDEAGEITDPPLEATISTNTTQYARSARTSLSVEPQGSSASIFCGTCLKNQHLFTSSLAQYLPSDPNDPEYKTLERNYYVFRRNLEKRYPQICAICEPKVAERVRQARYTAKTDYLRRMMEQSRAIRHTRKGITSLDVAHRLGKSLWWGGVLAQAAWHISTLEALSRPMLSPAATEEEGVWFYWPSWVTWSVRLVAAFARLIPGGPDMLTAGLVMSLMTLWWNPRFPQVFRGFSKPVHGLSSWYSIQIGILVCRFIFPHLDDMEVGRGDAETAHFCAHLVAAAIFVYALVSSRGMVKLDTTPLFGDDVLASPGAPVKLARMSSKIPVSPDTRICDPRLADVNLGSAAKHHLESQSLSSLLDDILTAPAGSVPPSPVSPTPLRRSLHDFSSPGSPSMLSSPIRRTNFGSLQMHSTMPGRTPRRLQAISLEDADSMDWSPTQPVAASLAAKKRDAPQKLPPLALQRSPTNSNPFATGKVKQEEHTQPFWFKVPPAPKPPVQRYLSERAAALSATNPLQTNIPGDNSRFGSGSLSATTPVLSPARNPFARASSLTTTGITPAEEPETRPFAVDSTSSASAVHFADPRFFAPSAQNDPRTDLASLLNRSFSLGPDEGDDPTQVTVTSPTHTNPNSSFGGSFRATSPTGSTSSIFSSPQKIAQRAETLRPASPTVPSNPFALQLLHSPMALPVLLTAQVALLWLVGTFLASDEPARLCQMAALGLAGAMAVSPVWNSITTLVGGRRTTVDDEEQEQQEDLVGTALAKTVLEAVVSVGELAAVTYFLTAVWVRDEGVAVDEGGSLVVMILLGHLGVSILMNRGEPTHVD